MKASIKPRGSAAQDSGWNRFGRRALAAIVAAMALSACGSDNGTGGTAPPPTAGSPAPAPPPAAGNTVPDSAGASLAAFIAYLRGLRTDETSAPVGIGKFKPPVDDTVAPTALGG